MRLLARIRTLARHPAAAGARPAGGRRVGRDHHGRQRPLGEAPRAADRGRPPGRCAHGAPHRRGGDRRSASHDLSVFAFSTENWSRPQDEVDALMEIFAETIERELPDLAEQGVRVRFIGRRDRAPETPAAAHGGDGGPNRAEHAPQPLGRVRLRRPRRARRGGAADRRERRRRRTRSTRTCSRRTCTRPSCPIRTC